MSFILDALRKSDQQRQRGAMPTLLTAVLPPEPRKPAYWIQVALGVVLIGAGIAIGLLRPWQAEQPAPAQTMVAAKPLEPMPRQAAPAAPPLVSTASPVPATTQNTAAASPSPVAIRPAPPPAVAVVPEKAPQPLEKPAGATDAAAEQNVIAMSELPASIRQELPAMQILLHLYSTKPLSRFVTINNQTLQEGEAVAPGLTLESITPEGMILSYKGYRFRRGVQ